MLLVIAAVPAETFLLRQQLSNPKPIRLGSYQLICGQLYQQPVLIAHSGVGQTCMAMRLTRVLENYSCSAVLLCGCGGSYPDSGLKTGDLTLAEEEIFGDLGVATADNFIPLEALDIPQDPQLMPPLQQRFDLRSPLLSWAKQQLPIATSGTFVTINCCSGHPQLSRELQQRTAGICENMEGAAAAQVCAEFNLPLLEVRGISNPTGSRELQDWDIKAGMTSAQQAILKLLKHWPTIQEPRCAN